MGGGKLLFYHPYVFLLVNFVSMRIWKVEGYRNKAFDFFS